MQTDDIEAPPPNICEQQQINFIKRTHEISSVNLPNTQHFGKFDYNDNRSHLTPPKIYWDNKASHYRKWLVMTDTINANPSASDRISIIS